MEKQEFKIGDYVTFNAYDEPIAAKVVGFEAPGDGWPCTDDWVYKLTGTGKTPLLSHTTGRSIEESTHFQPSQPEDKYSTIRPYLKAMEEESPIVSTSHLVLRKLNEKYGESLINMLTTEYFAVYGPNGERDPVKQTAA